MKKLKYLLLALILPAMFLFSACGDGQLGAQAQADIGNPENYVEATADQKTAFTTILNNEEAVGVKTYRITADMVMSGVSTKMNCIYNVAGETLELAMKMEASMEGVTETVKCYVKDNYAYGEFQGQSGDAMKEMVGTNKIKEPVEGDMLSDVISSLDSLTLDYSVERAKELDLADEAIGLKVEVSGETTRYELSREGAEGIKIYFVFEAGVLNAVQLEMATEANGYIPATSAKIVIEAFDGEIEFPDFNGFEEVTMGW